MLMYLWCAWSSVCIRHCNHLVPYVTDCKGSYTCCKSRDKAHRLCCYRLQPACSCICYFRFIDNWLDWFDRSQLKVIDGKLLVSAPHIVMKELQEFLGVEDKIGEGMFTLYYYPCWYSQHFDNNKQLKRVCVAVLLATASEGSNRIIY